MHFYILNILLFFCRFLSYNENIINRKKVKLMVNIPYDDLEMFMDWIKTKSELKFNPQSKNFPIIPNILFQSLA